MTIYFSDTEQAEIEEECTHSYEFIEPLPNDGEPDVYNELWGCIHCNKTRVLSAHVGVRDD